MLRTARILLGTVMVAGAALPAFALSPNAAKLAAAIEANGCKLTEGTAEAVQKASGLSASDGPAAAQELMSADLIEETSGGIALRTPVCLGAELAPAVAALTVAIRAKDCRLSPDISDDVVEHSGLRSGAAEEALEWMQAAGQLVAEGEDLKLKTEGCL